MNRNRRGPGQAEARFGSDGMIRAYLQSGGADVWPALREEFPTDESLLAALLVRWQELYDACLLGELADRRRARRSPEELIARAQARAVHLSPLLHRELEAAGALPILQVFRERHDVWVAQQVGLPFAQPSVPLAQPSAQPIAQPIAQPTVQQPVVVSPPLIPAPRRPSVLAREVAGAIRQDRGD